MRLSEIVPLMGLLEGVALLAGLRAHNLLMKGVHDVCGMIPLNRGDKLCSIYTE